MLGSILGSLFYGKLPYGWIVISMPLQQGLLFPPRTEKRMEKNMENVLGNRVRYIIYRSL